MARYIVTGAPGTGKTTVLGLLQDSITVVPEPARALIAEYRATAGGPTLDKLPDLFVDRLIERSIENYFAVPDDRPALFDRGLPDCVAYAAITGVDPAEAMRQAAAHRYDDPVFMAAPWEKVYTTDELRRATFPQVEAFHEELVSAYQALGYELVEMPLASPAERAAFIRNAIGP